MLAAADYAFLQVAGHRLRVTSIGDGAPLLLIMGMGGRAENWGVLLDSLPGRRVIAVDHPGMGESSTLRFPLPMSALADLYAAVLDELGITRADVLGYSFGGAIAQQLAHAYPARVGRLILAATLPAPWMVPLAPATMMAAILDGRAHRSGLRLRYLGVAWQAAAICSWTSLPWLHTIGHRTLVLAAGDDQIVPVEVCELLADRIPDATLEVVDGAGHLALCERPDVASTVDAFLAA